MVASASPEELEQLLAQNAALRKEVVAHASPEERLLGLGPAELLTLMKQIETYLQEQSASKQPPGEQS